jgi:hypothetical protein
MTIQKTRDTAQFLVHALQCGGWPIGPEEEDISAQADDEARAQAD